jgi:hypothetical protein
MSRFPPEGRTRMEQAILLEILVRPADQSRGRHNPRAVKRKMSSFPTRARADPAPKTTPDLCRSHFDRSPLNGIGTKPRPV